MGVHTFSKSICPKINVIVQMGFELTYFEAVVMRVSHDTED